MATATFPDIYTVLTPPVTEPVTITEAKEQLGLDVEQDEHNRFLLGKIATGRRYIERRLNVTFNATQYKAVWKDCPKIAALPAPPLVVDGDHTITVELDGDQVDEADYELDTDNYPGTIEFDGSPSGKLVVTYWAGAPAGTAPDPLLKSALLMYVDHAFRNRGLQADERQAESPGDFEAILAAASWSGRY